MCNTSRLAPHSDRFHTSSIQCKKKRWGLGEEGTCRAAVLAPTRCSQGSSCPRIWPRQGRARKASLEMGGRRERERHRRGRSAAAAGRDERHQPSGGGSAVGRRVTRETRGIFLFLLAAVSQGSGWADGRTKRNIAGVDA